MAFLSLDLRKKGPFFREYQQFKKKRVFFVIFTGKWLFSSASSQRFLEKKKRGAGRKKGLGAPEWRYRGARMEEGVGIQVGGGQYGGFRKGRGGGSG